MNNHHSQPPVGARADFWFGLGLIIFGSAVSFESWRMPRLTELNVHPMTAPGLVPGLIGIILAGLGIVLFIRASRQRGWRISPKIPDRGSEILDQTRRFLMALVLCIGYAAGLVGWIPFSVATGLFVFVFIVSFRWQRNLTIPNLSKIAAFALVQAVCIALAVTYVFETLFLVRLP